MATIKYTAQGDPYFDFNNPVFSDDNEQERSKLAKLIAEAVAAQQAQTQGSSNIQDVLPVTQPEPDPLELNTSWLDTIQPEQPVPELPTYNATKTLDMLQPSPQPPPQRGWVDRMMEPTTRVAAGMLSQVPRIVYGLGGGLAEISDIAKDSMRHDQWNPFIQIAAAPSQLAESMGYPDWAKRVASKGQVAADTINEILDVNYAPTPAGKAGQFFGENLIPLRQYTLPVAGGLAALQSWRSSYVTPPEAVSRGTNLLDTAREQAQTQADIDKKHQDAGYQEGPREYDENGKLIRRRAPRPDLAGTVDVPVDTIGGPTVVKKSDFTALGYMTVATIGMIAAPQIWARMQGTLPSLRSMFQWPAPPVMRPTNTRVEGLAREVTHTATTPMDYVRTMDDATAGITRQAERLGVIPSVVRSMEDRFHTLTHASGQSLADNAVMHGRAYTPNFQFQTRTPVAQIARQDSPEFTRYIQLRDTFDEISKIDTAIAQGTRAALPGPTTYRGMDMPTVLREQFHLEQTNPTFRNLQREYSQNLVDTWRFMHDGQYGILTGADHAFLRAQNRNHMPDSRQPGLGRIDTHFVNEGAATSNLADYIHHNVRMRLNNEARGQYIDAVRAVTGDRIFNPISARQAERLERAGQGVVNMRRRGHPENYSTDVLLADVLKLDPAFFTGGIAIAANSTKRFFEATTTGMLAPQFAPTSMVRNHLISLVTAPSQYRNSFGVVTELEGVGVGLGTAAAIPRQLGPQMARSAANVIERAQGGRVEREFDRLSQNITNALNQGSGGWLGQVFTPPTMQGLGRRLAHVYDTSIYAQLQSVGTHRGSLLQQQQVSNNNLIRAAQEVQLPWARDFLNGYQALIHSIHESAAFNFAHKNFARVPIDKLALEARRLTGDNRIAGQYRVGTEGRPIRFEENPASLTHTLGMPIARKYGAISEGMRAASPWYNQTLQGIKRIGEEYLKDPTGFTIKTWLYAIMPSVALEAYTRALGNDPDGVSYSVAKHTMRTDYGMTMQYWVPLPGRSWKDAVVLPRVHEFSGLQRASEVAFDHISRTNVYPLEEDMKRLALSFVESALTPAMPPIGNALLGSIGQTGMMGVYGGGSWTRRSTPFDTSGGMQVNVELIMRAFMGGLAETIGQGYAAYSNTDPEWKTGAPGNAASAAMRSIVRRSPIVRDVAQELPFIAGSSPTIDWMYEHNKQINDLLNFYRTENARMGIDNRPASKAGDKITREAHRRQGIPEELPQQSAGVDQKEPTNPLYTLFISQLNDRMRHDAPATGGIGMRTEMRRYADVTENLNRLRGVNAGSHQYWQDQLKNKDEMMDLMKTYRVDTTNLRDVKNFFLRQRHEIAGIVRNTIMAVEEDFTRQAQEILTDPVKRATASPQLIQAIMAMGGKPIKFKDLDPYKQLNPREVERRGVETDPPMISYEPDIELPY